MQCPRCKCKDCPDRSVEPLCRLTCESWKEHEQERAQHYEEHQRELDYDSYEVERIMSRRMRHYKNVRDGRTKGNM